MKKIFVTGDIRAGKTHQILLSAAASGLRVTGFTTLRSGECGDITFSLVDAGELVARTHESMQSPEEAGNGLPRTAFMQVNQTEATFDALKYRTRALELMDRPGDLLILDEIGGLELLDDLFFERLLLRLEGPGIALISYKLEKNTPRVLERNRLEDEKRRIFYERRKILQKAAFAQVTVDVPTRKETELILIDLLSRHAVESHA